MYKVSQAYLNKFKQSVQTFRLKGKVNDVSFTHNDILSGSFKITNQCSEQNDVRIGSVYIGELKCTFKPGILDKWENAVITVSEGLKIGNGYEDVPLGKFFVKEAEDTAYGVDITAYDGMCRFSKKCRLDATMGTAFDLLTMACKACKIEFGMTETEVKAFPNGTKVLSLYSQNDIETWQDFIFWTAQTLAAFATMDRQGRLVLRAYENTAVDTLTNHERFTDSKFSRFTTRYSGISVVNIKNAETRYYNVKPDEYLTYNLGSNPFLQYGTKDYVKEECTEILKALAAIRYVPFETGVLCGAIYDLGDVIKCTDGIAEKGKTGCLMAYEYTFNGGSQISGFGADPDLANAKSKTDKNIAGLLSEQMGNQTQIIEFINAMELTASDMEVEIIRMRTVTTKDTLLQFIATVLCTVIPDTEGGRTECKVIYKANDVEMAFHPEENWSGGKHILNLLYGINLEESGVLDWSVLLKSAGGSVHIEAEGIRAYISGQGISTAEEWDGTITVEERLSHININSIKTAQMNEVVTVNRLLPTRALLTEQLSRIHINDITIMPAKDTLSIDSEADKILMT